MYDIFSEDDVIKVDVHSLKHVDSMVKTRVFFILTEKFGKTSPSLSIHIQISSLKNISYIHNRETPTGPPC